MSIYHRIMANCEQCIVRELSSLKFLKKEELLKLSDCKETHTVKKGEAIFEEGDVINGIYCITEGICKLSKLNTNGKDYIVKLIQKGELLGQRSIISEESVNLSAVAIEDMKICFIPKTEILDFFDKNRLFSMDVMKSVCENLKEADNHIVNMAQKNVKQRLAETLIYLDSFGKNEDDSLRVQLSREELASMIGTATESCIRLLSDFNKLGLIQLSSKKIIIKELNKLKKIAE